MKEFGVNSVSGTVYDSAKQISPAFSEVRELRNYRYLLAQLVRRDIVTRYKRTSFPRGPMLR